ncbi:LuxR family transcriptional regulator [Rhizobium sp. BK661]|uniref:helix-turn-helix transcriptional regulator n=1 Tax=Rhizobium sp. BK661 TaxID=2586991 RepID=UPI0021674FBE|nr:LuxR family transcriptional regulator [Rhizobium sp. BK661]MCS3743629.1 DNA-binding CsgD family transcriptional regulator [Rhizobium sp. BK661]
MSALVSDVLYEFLVGCEEPADLQQIFGTMEKVSHQLGIDYFAMAFLPLAHERLDSLVWQRWPDGWLNRYLQNNYFHADPVVSLVRATARPSVWSQSVRAGHLSGRPKRIMDEARDFGMLDGLTIPLHSRSGLAGLFSVAGRRVPVAAPEVALLQFVAETTHRRIMDLNTPPEPCLRDDLQITRSESECLTLCAAGKTDREIGSITYRSQRTVQQHIRNLQQKLGVSNRAQLIAESFRRGLQR